MILIQEEGKISGFMLATVLSNSGEQSKGKLKLRLLCEGQTKNVLEDVKVVTPFGGADYGIYCLPEVGEQVLVGFLGGSFDRPFVFGSVYAAGDQILSDSYDAGNTKKRLVTKGGSTIEILDTKGEETISVRTPNKKLSIELSQKTETAVIKAGENKVVLDNKKNTVQVKAAEKIELETGSTKLKMESNGAVQLKGENIQIKGSSVKISSSGLLNLKGQSLEASGSMVNLKANGEMAIRGSITKIN